MELVDTLVLEASDASHESSSLSWGTNIMNIALTSIDPSIDISPFIEILNPRIILTSPNINVDKKLADLALELDQKIYLENLNIDIVYVVNTINFNKLMLDNIDSDCVYYASNNLHASSFYCSPSVFSLLGSLYKIDVTQYQFKYANETSAEVLAEKIFWFINRLGIKFKIV